MAWVQKVTGDAFLPQEPSAGIRSLWRKVESTGTFPLALLGSA